MASLGKRDEPQIYTHQVKYRWKETQKSQLDIKEFIKRQQYYDSQNLADAITWLIVVN